MSRDTLPPASTAVLPPACKAHGCRVDVATDPRGVISVRHTPPGTTESALFFPEGGVFSGLDHLWADVLDWLADQHQREA